MAFFRISFAATLVAAHVSAQALSAQVEFKPPAHQASFAEDLLSLLEPPAGAQRFGSTAGQSDVDANASQLMRSELLVGDLMTFYQVRLSDRGWHPVSHYDDPQLGVQTWRFSDPAGAELLAVLVVVATNPDLDMKAVSLQVFLVDRQ